MNTDQQLDNTLVIPVDQEHGALRLVIVLSFIVIWIVAFIIFSTAIPNDGFSLLAVLLGFGCSYLLTTLLERSLKPRWPSGRVVKLGSDGVKMLQKDKLQQQVLSEDPANAVFWQFKVTKGRTRVPKGWLMLACALEFENDYLTVYTFMSAAQLEAYDMAPFFKKLVGKRKGKSDEDAREDLRLAGEQRRLRDAENQRWMFGAEMTPADFQTYLSRLKTQFPEWMPVN